jgi:hypothetical protein
MKDPMTSMRDYGPLDYVVLVVLLVVAALPASLVTSAMVTADEPMPVYAER